MNIDELTSEVDKIGTEIQDELDRIGDSYAPVR